MLRIQDHYYLRRFYEPKPHYNRQPDFSSTLERKSTFKSPGPVSVPIYPHKIFSGGFYAHFLASAQGIVPRNELENCPARNISRKHLRHNCGRERRRMSQFAIACEAGARPLGIPLRIHGIPRAEPRKIFASRS